MGTNVYKCPRQCLNSIVVPEQIWYEEMGDLNNQILYGEGVDTGLLPFNKEE